MKTFRPNSHGEWPRADLRKIEKWIETSFRRHGADMPRVVAIAAGEFAYDDHHYETFFELAPGVIASSTWDLSEERKEELHQARWETIDRDVASVGSAAADIALHYLALGTDSLADCLHDIRTMARRTLAEVATAGGGPRLISVRLTGGDWLHSDEFRVILRLECLDRHLFTDIEELEFEHVGAINEELQHWGRRAAANYALRHALAAQGATGTIDLIALNALAMFGDAAATLRGIGEGFVPWSSNAMELIGEAGHLWSHGVDHTSGLSWQANLIRHPTVVPASVLMACAGRPVTDLITHPILTADMTIVEASRDPETGKLKVEADQPRWLFCHQSGRAWPAASLEAGAATWKAIDDAAAGEEK